MIFAGSQRIAMQQVTSGSTSYFHPDHLGSTSVLTDSTGASEQDVAYYPYGDTRSNTGTADVAYKYTGKEQDDSTGLYFYEARYYDPVLGRFISPDTIVPNPGNPQSLNRYSYVLNNPLRYTDPSGQVPITLGRGEITIPLGDNVGTLTVASDFGFGYVGSGVPGGQLDITFDPVVYAILGLVPESVRAVLLKFIIEDRPKLYSVSSSGADFSSLANSSGSDSAEVQPLNVPFVVPQTSGAGSRRGEFFIQQPVVAGFLGDGRPRDPSPNPDQSRAFFDVNFDTGSGRFRVNPSCLAAGACFSAFPRGGGNSLDIFQSDNAVIITGTVTNSAVPLFPNIFVPSITFYFKIGPASIYGRIDAHFPSFELTETINGQTRELFFRGESLNPLAAPVCLSGFCGTDRFFIGQ